MRPPSFFIHPKHSNIPPLPPYSLPIFPLSFPMPLKSASVPRSPSSPSSPYPSSTARRTSSQPKSSRQQFSACGACRMRRWGLPLMLYLVRRAHLGRPEQSSLRFERLAFFEHRHTATVFQLQRTRSQMRVCVLPLFYLVPLLDISSQ